MRILSYNVERNLVDAPSRSAAFQRILTSVDPDVIVFQEIVTGVSNTELRDFLNDTFPGESWTVHRGEGGFIQSVLASRFPISLTRTDTTPEASTRGVTMGLIDLPDDIYDTDLYMMGVHLKCCGSTGSSEDESRQRSTDAMVNWIRDIQTTGGFIDLPENTPILAAGDFNFVGGNQPPNTLLTGNIINEGTYGSDFSPDWDRSDLLDVRPQDPNTGNEATWPSDTSNPFSRLDRFYLTDSVAEVEGSFVLNTRTMSSSARGVAGLNSRDTDEDTTADHLPMVVDLSLASSVDFPPNVDNVRLVTIGGGRLSWRFETDEVATARVTLSTECGGEPIREVLLEANDSFLVDFFDLQNCLEYFLTIEATDLAGNSRVANNDGACFRQETFGTCTTKGDLNRDGSITPNDAQRAFECFLTGACDPTVDSFAGDVCPEGGDGFVTPADVQAIFQAFQTGSILCSD